MSDTSGDEYARHTDPDTSKTAGHLRRNERVAIEKNLLLAYARAAVRGAGLSSEEAMYECNYDIANDGHRRRCSDLVRKKNIAPQFADGQKVKRYVERTGAYRTVYVITDVGIDRLIADGLI